jgi:hypothetical protein
MAEKAASETARSLKCAAVRRGKQTVLGVLLVRSFFFLLFSFYCLANSTESDCVAPESNKNKNKNLCECKEDSEGL